MKFSGDKPIYLQIADHVKTMIAKQQWKPGERIPSIRELAIQIEVNPNTVSKTYFELQAENIIFNKRGLGYFVAEEAADSIQEQDLDSFYRDNLPAFFKQMKRLNITIEDLKNQYEKFINDEADHEKE